MNTTEIRGRIGKPGGENFPFMVYSFGEHFIVYAVDMSTALANFRYQSRGIDPYSIRMMSDNE